MLSRKAQGISINTIIIAAIALIVLVVLVMVFTGRIGVFSKGVGETAACATLGGKCQTEPCNSNQEQIISALDCDRDFDGDGEKENEGEPYCCKQKI